MKHTANLNNLALRATKLALSIAIVALVVSMGLNVPVYSDEIQNNASNETSRFWFVKLSSAPLSDVDSSFTPQQTADYLAQLATEQQNFRTEALAYGVTYKERFSYSVLWNGLSIEVDAANLAKLGHLSTPTALIPVQTVPVPDFTQSTEDPDLLTALAMTGADVAQSELGYNGTGIKVAVMDTGVDYNHPDLGGCFGTGCRVRTGYDFVGDAYNADPTSPSYNPVPSPDPDPMDCNGHGTHVTGIVGASGGVTGVAPGVTFGAYRVFGCQGSTTDDVMLAAMERILADKMDVLNMSIGSAFAWPQSPTAEGSDRLVNKGIVVVASIGNSGANGLYSAGAPGVGKKVIGVASFDNTHVNVISFTVSPDAHAVGYIAMTGSPDPPVPPTSGTANIVFVGRGCNSDAYLANPAGKVALISRGTCTFNEKYQKAKANGAIGVVIHNNNPGIFSGTLGAGTGNVFCVGISQADGLLIRSRLTASPPVTITFTNNIASVPNPTGGLISSFSSYGLTADLDLKPDIGAPGGFIRSTWPLAKGAYTVLSGTSMSSPHVAGAVALYLQAHPHASPQAVRDILQNSADPAQWAGNPSLGFLDNVHRQGAGMLDIDDAILATTQIYPGKLALGESQAGPATRTLTIENNGDVAVTYDLGHIGALSTTGSTFSPSFTTGFATVAYTQYGVPVSSLTVPANGQALVNVTITANPSLPDKSIYGGYLTFTPEATSPSVQLLRVPYAGFKGDYQSIVALTPTSNGFPWLAKLSGSTFTKQNNGTSYTFVSGDVPYILVHLDHQVRRLKAEVYDANTGQYWFKAFDFQYVQRSSTVTSFFAISWDGLTTHGNIIGAVPNGKFIIKLTVEKALGDDNNPADFETWYSPTFYINRPGPTLRSPRGCGRQCTPS